ncbi:efflux RND transporter periplasmic adaptor subunit [Reinekea forsetii]|nr:efflux RND transporter periplasmic adaptor subunit [Reinekea forsetii]
MKIWQTGLSLVGIGLVTAGVISVMGASGQATEIEAPKPEATTSVQTITLDLASYQPEIRLIGQIEPSQQLDIVSEISASVLETPISSGDVVDAGVVLVQLDDFDVQQSLAQAQANAADIAAQIQLFDAQQALSREALQLEQDQLSLLNDKYKQQKAVGASAQTLADLKQQVSRQNHLVKQAQQTLSNAPINRQQLLLQQTKLNLALKSAQRQANKATIVAPFNGQVAALHAKANQLVSPGSALLKFVSHDDMRVKVNLPITLATMRQQLTGRIESNGRASNIRFNNGHTQVQPGSAGLVSWFDIDDDENWIVGEVVDVTLHKPKVVNAFKVPVSALFQDKWIYSVDEEQKLKPIEVKLHGRVRENSQDWLIVTPTQSIASKQRILVTRLNNPTTGLKIFERGVDPEPVPESESEADES